MYLYPGKFFSHQDRQVSRERFAKNKRYKKFFPLLQRYNFISNRTEQSRRNDIEENSFRTSQVD